MTDRRTDRPSDRRTIFGYVLDRMAEERKRAGTSGENASNKKRSIQHDRCTCKQASVEQTTRTSNNKNKQQQQQKPDAITTAEARNIHNTTIIASIRNDTDSNIYSEHTHTHTLTEREREREREREKRPSICSLNRPLARSLV